MISHEEIKRANPIFNVFSCQILTAEKVSVISSQNNSESERILVVGTPGVGIFRERLLPRGLFQRRFFSYGDITKLVVNSRYVRVIAGTEEITFKHANHLRIAARIHATRCAIFDPSDAPYSIEVASEVENPFAGHVFVYHTSSLLADRFLANVVNTKQTLDSGTLEKICRHLMELKPLVDVNKELLSMSHQQAIACALSFDHSITGLRIKGVSFGLAGPFVASVLSRSSSIRRVMFVKTRFDQVCQEYLDMVQRSDVFRAEEWIFEECALDVGYFMKFFDPFIKYKGNVKILTFNKCRFSQDVFASFSQTLLFSKCFQRLEVLWLSDVQFPDDMMEFLMQLFGSDWLIKNRTLQTLAILNSVVHLDEFFERLMRFDTGIVTVNMSGNVFVNVPSADLVKAFSSQANLVLANCGFVDGSMEALFQSLSHHKGVSLSLDCSAAMIGQSERLAFESVLPTFVLPTLTEFVWDRNAITPENVAGFIEFFRNQPKLTSLSISDCIDAAHAQDVLVPLLDYFKVCSLSSFTIASSSTKTSLGPLLTPVLEHVLKRYTLKHLDITGQNIGSDGLIVVTNLLPLAMEEFRFEGNSISSADALIQIMQTLLDKRLKVLTWPEQDVKPSLVNVPISQRTDFVMRIELIRKQYYQQYGRTGVNESADVALATIMKYATVANPTAHDQKTSKGKVCAFEGETVSSSSDMDIFRIQDEETKKLLAECEFDDKNDPMMAMYEFVCHEFSLETLTASLQ